MKYHLFPGTDLSVSQLCFGCWGIISDLQWGTREKDTSVQAILAAVDAGINFFDTAPLYGDGASEKMLGETFAENGLRKKVVIASKIRPDKMKPSDVKTECEESLARLQTDYLDLYQTHWTSPEVPIADTWGAMRELQQEGKVRQIGVCNAGVIDLDELPSQCQPITNQLPYNLLSRMIEFEIQPRCVERQIGILVYSPLMHGLLADKYKSPSEVPDGRARTRHFSSERPSTRHGEPGCEAETFAALDRIREIASAAERSMSEIALAWAIAQPGIVSVIAGARNADQVRQNVGFLQQSIAPETIAELNNATNVVKERLGKNPDLWDGGTNSRYH